MVKKVLLVTPDQLVASMVKEKLIDVCELTLVEDGTTANEYVRKFCPNFIMIDLDSDVLKGIEIVSTLREWTSIPIIFLSNATEQLIKFHNTKYLKKTEDREVFENIFY